jgi:eukaryotic-like serine/threonine-protein kinase
MVVRAPPLPPRYRGVRPVGRGGMADIYRATDTELDRDVAVKVLAEHLAEDEDVRARFLHEALAAARLSGDPHTVSVYDVGECEGRPFLVMSYLRGGSLADRLGGGRIPQTQALVWIDQASRALDSAHAHGVVHRDVKPGNLLLDENGNVYVADFGIARADGLDSHTQTGVVMGTAGYLSPEQEQGACATAASDRYALAVVAYELLTGSRPSATPPFRLPHGVEAVFARGLAWNPEDRFASCLEFSAALRAALAGAREPATAPLRRRRRPSRAPLVIALVIALALLSAVLAVGLSAHGRKPEAPPVVVRTVTAPARAPAQPAADVSPSQPDNAGASEENTRHGRGHGKKKDD